MNEQDWMCRTELLLTEKALNRLKKANVLVVGMGGVGGYAAEQLCRAGIGQLTIVDNDTIHPSNKNRQLIALDSTMGNLKIDSFYERFSDINADAKSLS
jgi:tRNA A37 threonylcarbamoyladenosine dehydratase